MTEDTPDFIKTYGDYTIEIGPTGVFSIFEHSTKRNRTVLNPCLILDALERISIKDSGFAIDLSQKPT